MNLNSSIITTANELKKHDKDFINLSKQANTILSHLSESIHTAHSDGKMAVAFKVPNFLQVDGFSNKDSQLYIFTAILKHLEEKNYRARIQIEKEESVIFVTWKSERERLEIQTLQEYLKTRAVNICQKET